MTAFGPARPTGTQDVPAPRGGTIRLTPSLQTLTAPHMERIMEIFLWIAAFVLICVVPCLIVRQMGRIALSQYRTEKDEPEAPAYLRRHPNKTRQDTRIALRDWQKEFQAILQKTCTKHEYDRDRWKDWWKCIHCEAEEEWAYSGGCACRAVPDRNLEGKPIVILMERNRFCTIHGRGPAVRAIQNFEKYSRGGRTS